MKSKLALLVFFISFFVFSQKRSVFDIARNGTVEELKELMNNDANIINATSEMGFSPLILACYRGNKDVAVFLIENVKDVNYKSGEGTALAALSINYNKDLVLKLLEKKADPNIKDSQGITPLFWAVKRGNAELVKILLDHKADKNIKDEFGVSPFEHAIMTKNTEIINLLKS